MKREICAPEVPASQMVLTIITDEQLEAFADAVITKYQQNIARRKAAEPSPEEWMTRKEVMALLKRCDSTMTKILPISRLRIGRYDLAVVQMLSN